MDMYGVIYVTDGPCDGEVQRRCARQVGQMWANGSPLVPRDMIGHDTLFSDPVKLEMVVIGLGTEESTREMILETLKKFKEQKRTLVAMGYSASIPADVGVACKIMMQEGIGAPISYAEVWENVSPGVVGVKFYSLQVFEGTPPEIPAASKPVKSWTQT